MKNKFIKVVGIITLAVVLLAGVTYAAEFRTMTVGDPPDSGSMELQQFVA